MAKRGRKRKGYFYEEQEQAVVDYILAETKEDKNKIFNTWLKPAFTKMIESIIRRYKLYIPDEEFDNTFNDTFSFLMTKIELFDPSKGFKAYSYCGTICKHYLLYKLNKGVKIREKEEPYEDFYDVFSDDNNYVVEECVEETQEQFLTDLITNTCTEIRRIIEEQKPNPLTHDEERVGMALLDLFENWEEVFRNLGSNKFNKTSILLYLKEVTHLSTPEIRSSMKKYKTAYYGIKKLMLEN